MDLEGPWGSWSVEFPLGFIWGSIALGCSLGESLGVKYVRDLFFVGGL